MLVTLHNLISACVSSTIPCSVRDVSVDGGCLYVISAVWKVDGGVYVVRNVWGSYFRLYSLLSGRS